MFVIRSWEYSTISLMSHGSVMLEGQDHGDDLGHESHRLLLDLGEGLQQADEQPDQHAGQQHRRADQQA